MSGDPGEAALDGRSNGPLTLGNGQVIQDGGVLPWRPVKHYRQVTDSRDRNVARNSGTLGQAGQGGPAAGTVWDSPSTLDAVTVLSEVHNVVYLDPTQPAGQNDFTLADIQIELFKDLRARQAAAKAT